MKTKKHHSVYFRLFREVDTEVKSLENERPRGSWGVMVGEDEYSVRWRAIRMRYEILLAYLKGEHPNWGYAYWLGQDEVIRRNNYYHKTPELLKP